MVTGVFRPVALKLNNKQTWLSILLSTDIRT